MDVNNPDHIPENYSYHDLSTWPTCKVPKGITVEQLTFWLENNLEKYYIWDTVYGNIVHFQSKEDMTLFKLTWY